MDRIGFLGVGHLATAMISGLVRSGWPAQALLVAPRGAGHTIGHRLGIEVAGDNAALVSRCDMIVLAVRSRDAEEALGGLPWRRDHLIVSVCAGVGLGALSARASSPTIVRAMPLTAAEFCASPTTLFPDDPRARALLSRLGPVIALDAEHRFEVATVSAAAYGWAQVLVGQVIAWSTAKGLPEPIARQLAAATFVAAGRNVAERAEPLGDLIRALVTPGGITERGLDVLRSRDVPAAWDEAYEAVHAQLAR